MIIDYIKKRRFFFVREKKLSSVKTNSSVLHNEIKTNIIYFLRKISTCYIKKIINIHFFKYYSDNGYSLFAKLYFNYFNLPYCSFCSKTKF